MTKSRRPVPAAPEALNTWSAAALRCPCCFSPLNADDARRPTTVRCGACLRAYPVQQLGPEGRPVPRLKRDDPIATLDHDVVVAQTDPASLRLDYRRHVSHVERREQFLAPMIGRVSDPYAIIAARGDARRVPPTEAEGRAFDRFTRSLREDAVVLDLACGDGLWLDRLLARGLRVIGVDASAPRLTRAAEVTVGHDDRVLLVEADMMEMPFDRACVDGVWCSQAFEYVRPDRRAVFFRQVNRVLRPGGVLFLSAETTSLPRIMALYLLWRLVFRQPVIFWEYIYRLPRSLGGGWHYHAMTTARALERLCREHGFRVLSLHQDDALWLLVARKDYKRDV